MYASGRLRYTSMLTAVWTCLNLVVMPTTIPLAGGGPTTQVSSPLDRADSCLDVDTCITACQASSDSHKLVHEPVRLQSNSDKFRRSAVETQWQSGEAGMGQPASRLWRLTLDQGFQQPTGATHQPWDKEHFAMFSAFVCSPVQWCTSCYASCDNMLGIGRLGR